MKHCEQCYAILLTQAEGSLLHAKGFKGWSIVVKNARAAETSPRGSREAIAHRLLLNGALYWDVCYSNLNRTEVTSSEYSKISFSFFLLNTCSAAPHYVDSKAVSLEGDKVTSNYSCEFALLKTNGLPGLRENIVLWTTFTSKQIITLTFY